jgi:hypothetical protein
MFKPDNGTMIEECHLLGCYIVRLLLRTDISEENSASIIRVTRHSISLQRGSVASYG